MAEQTGNNGGNTKNSLTLIVALFAVISGVYSMLQPMGQRIDFISTQLEGVIARETASMKEEREDHALLKTLATRLLQLEKDRDTSKLRQNDHDLRVRGINAAQWERIKALERDVYGKSMSVSIGEAPGAESN